MTIYDVDCDSPLIECGCLHCVSQGKHDQTEDCVYWRTGE